MFKKTFPLTNGTVDLENGIVYFGDGNWGVSPSYFPFNQNKTGIFEAVGNYTHVWIVEANSTKILFTPFASNGTQIMETIPQKPR